jgi:hypothetical protein
MKYLTSVVDSNTKKDKPFYSGKYSEALKHRKNTIKDIDKHTTETEYSILWNDREVSKEGYKFLSPQEIKSLSQKHLPCQDVCCSAMSDLAEIGILQEYRQHRKQVRDQQK